MFAFLSIAGGVTLILFGARFLQKGLDRLFGPQLSQWVQRMAHSRMRAFASGLGVSLIAPSSTTISILAVQAVRSGHLSSQKMLAVILGANVGLTFMVLLIALRLEAYAPVLIFVGVVLFQFMQRSLIRGIGQVILALGFIFMAISLIKSTAEGFEPGGDLMQLMELAEGHPVWLAVLAALLAVMMQSSTAAIGLFVALGAADAVSMAVALPAIAGANVGLALNTLIVGWPRVESRRLGLGNVVCKGTVAVLVLLLLPLLLGWLGRVPLEIDKQIALSHTSFNVVMALIFLPLVPLVHALLRRMVPDRAEPSTFGPRYITRRPMEGFSLAAGQSMREILRVSEIVRSMLSDVWRAVEKRDAELAQQVQDRDDQVDLLDEHIKRFLAEVASREGQGDASGEIMRQLRYLTELETIGDIIDKNIAELAIKRAKQNITFSREGWAELQDFYQRVTESMLIAETAFTTRDATLARQLLRNKERISQLEREMRDNHFDRLKTGHMQTHESSAVHLDLLTHLKRVNAAVSHLAYAILQDEEGRTGEPSPPPYREENEADDQPKQDTP